MTASVLEIARGCTRGCGFCQAGMIWRPYREKEMQKKLITEMADKALQTTGHDEISLLALSSETTAVLNLLFKT